MFDARLTKSFAAFCLLLLVLLSAYYWPWLSGDRAFYQSDLTYYFEPFVRFICDAYRQGKLPLWNPYLYCGMSQIAVPSPGMFYPPIAFFFLPFSRGTGAFLLMHQFLAGAGTFLLVAGFGWGIFAATIAGLSFALCGYMFALQANFTLVASIAWLPLLLYVLNSMDSTFSTKNVIRVIGGAAVMALMIGAGRPELSVPAAMVATVFVLATAFGDYRRHRHLRSALLRATWPMLSMLCGALLAAPVILPALEWARLSPRSNGLELQWVLTWSANWYDCLSMICAHPVGDLTFLGNPYLNMVASRVSRLPYLCSSYLGPMVITLGIWSLFDHRWKWRWGVVALGTAALLMSLGKNTPLAESICQLSPVLAVFRYPVKLIIFPTLAIIILAARGAMVASERGVARGPLITTNLFWLAWLICGTIFLTMPELSQLTAKFPWNAKATVDILVMKQAQLEFGRSFMIAAALGFFVCGAYWAYARNKLNRRVFELALTGAVAANLLVPSWKYLQHGTASDFYDRESPVAYLVQQLLAGDRHATTQSPAQRINHRVLTLYFDPLITSPYFIAAERLGYQPGFYLYARHLLLPNNNIDFQVPVAFGYEAAEIDQYKKLFTEILAKSTQRRKHNTHDAITDAPMARFCKITSTSLVLTQCFGDNRKTIVPLMDRRYFTPTYQNLSMNVRMFAALDCLPRAYFAAAVRQANFEEFLKVMLDEHSTKLPEETFVSGDFPMSSFSPSIGSNSGDIRFLSDENDKVVLSTSTASPRLLVLNDQFYPGWQATVDQTPTTIYKVNYFARAVFVPAGNHQVQFVYRPQSLLIGIACAAAVIGTLLLALIFCLRRRPAAVVE